MHFCSLLYSQYTRSFGNNCSNSLRETSVSSMRPSEVQCCQGMKQLMAGGGVALIGITLVPLLSGLFTA